jgi:hypothetical protein
MTVQEAAATSGMTDETVRRIARSIRSDTSYTIMGITLDRLQKMKSQGGIIGLPSQAPESLPILQGTDLKRTHQGRLIINAEMVGWWKRTEDHMNELRAQGCCTIEEAAASNGVTVNEIKQALKTIQKQQQRKG